MSRIETLQIVTEALGEPRLLLTIRAARDNSFFVHPSRPEGQRWRFPSAIDRGDHFEIDFANYVEPSLNLQKVTIHRSGFLHATDGASRRFRDGLRVPSFPDMKLPFEVCVFAPSDPSTLPVRRASNHPVLAITREHHEPFVLRFHVCGPDTAHPAPNSVKFMFGSHHFGLAVTSEFVPNATPSVPVPWPPYPFFILLAGS